MLHIVDYLQIGMHDYVFLHHLSVYAIAGPLSAILGTVGNREHDSRRKVVSRRETVGNASGATLWRLARSHTRSLPRFGGKIPGTGRKKPRGVCTGHFPGDAW